MSNKREMEPSLDFYELRKRHEAYKKNQQKARSEAADEAQSGAEARPLTDDIDAADTWSVPRREPADERADEAVEDASALPGETAEGEFTVEDFADGPQDAEDEPEDGDEDEDGETDAERNNPFQPFLKVIKGLGKRFGRGAKEDGGDSEDGDDLEDDSGDSAEALTLTDTVAGEGAPAPARPLPERDVPEVEDAGVEDILEEVPARRRSIAPPPEDGDAPEDGEADPDEDGEGEEAPRSISGFKRFLRLFVMPIDEAGLDDGEEDEDAYEDEDEDDGEEAPRERRGLFRRRAAREDAYEIEDDEADERPSTEGIAEAVEPVAEAPVGPAAADEIEGGADMSDLNNVNAELTNELAAELGTPGMSRRERRELALRQAAEKAAAEAAAEAGKPVEAAVSEAVEAVQGAEEKAEAAVEKAMEADVVEDVASGIVKIESAKDDFDDMLDEPTREYKAVSRMDFEELASQSKAASEAGDDEDEDEEEEKPRRGLFGRRRKAEEVEEDYDDEDEDEDDEEEEEKPRRRGLFGRRRKDGEDEEDYDDEDEDEDDDEEDEKPSRRNRRRYDEDDYDDYDDGDEDDEDYDEDYEDYDDEDDGGSFGHVLLGILKGFLTAVMVLLFVVVVLNVLNIFNVLSLDNFARRLPDKMVNVLLPSQSMKKRINVEANADTAPVQQFQSEIPAPEEPAAEPAPEAPVQPEAAPAEGNAGAVG